MPRHYCYYCPAAFPTEDSANRHHAVEHPEDKNIFFTKEVVSCVFCSRSLDHTKASNRLQHARVCPANQNRQAHLRFKCDDCDKAFTTSYNLGKHKSRNHGTQSDDSPTNKKVNAEDIDEVEPSNANVDQLVADYIDGKIDNSDLFTLETVYTDKDLNVKEKKMRVELSETATDIASAGMLILILSDIIDGVMKQTDLNDDDRIQMAFESSLLDFPCSSGAMLKKHFATEDFLSHIQAIHESERLTDAILDNLFLTVWVIQKPEGKLVGSTKISLKNCSSIAEFLKRSTAFLDPSRYQKDIFKQEGRHVSCVAVAVTLLLDYESSFTEKQGRRLSQSAKQRLLALEQATAIFGKPLVSQDDFEQIGSYISDAFNKRFVVLSLHFTGSCVKFSTTFAAPSRRLDSIYILEHESHAYAVIDPKKAVGGENWCKKCEVVITPEDPCQCFRCGRRCTYCKSVKCKTIIRRNKIPNVLCSECNFFYLDEYCFREHEINGKCKTRYRCEKCHRAFNPSRKNNHGCGTMFCHTCRKVVEVSNHICYIQQPKTGKKFRKTVVFDIETSACDSTDSSVKALLFAMLISCDVCIEISESETSCCGPRRYEWFGESCVEQAVKFIFLSGKFKGCLFLAHNFAGFDSQCVFLACIKQKIRPVKVVTKGLRIIQLKCKGVTFRDTLMLLPSSLDNIARSFNLPTTKSFFPYKVLTKETLYQTLPGPPDKTLFEPDRMSEERRRDFDIWYEEQKHKPFIIPQRISRYCWSDVDLLTQVVSKFRAFFHERFSFDPFSCMSLASLCQFIYLRFFLPSPDIDGEPVLAVISDKNDRVASLKENSHTAIKYLSYLNSHLPVEERIQHAGNSVRETVIAAHPVDGYIPSKKHVINIHGCFFHGCLLCYPDRNRKHPIRSDLTFHEVYQASLKRDHDIRASGHTLEIVWSHEIEEKILNDKNFAEFLRRAARLGIFTDPLRVRDCLRGGRVESIGICAQLDTSKNHRIRCFDLASQYPSIMMTHHFPQGKPQIIEGSTIDQRNFNLDDYFGVISCVVLPRQNQLLIGLLPYTRGDNSLVFPLCRSCLEEQATPGECHHKIEERVIKGVFYTEELKFAVKHGYKVLRVFEVWHFKKKSDKLFIDYFKTFAKLKMASTKLTVPRERFVAECYQELGIDMTDTVFLESDFFRLLAKLMCNSLWGKFAMKECTTTRLCHSAEEVWKLTSSSDKPANVKILGNENVIVECSEESHANNRNLVIACAVTAMGRVGIAEKILELGPLALYCDTDSITFIDLNNKIPFKKGANVIGQFVEEKLDMSPISEFISLGSKCYALKSAATNKVYTKAKGIQLKKQPKSHQASFETFKAILFNEIDENRGVGKLIKTSAELSSAEKWILSCKNRPDEKTRVVAEFQNPGFSRKWGHVDQGFLHHRQNSTRRLKVNFDRRLLVSPSDIFECPPGLILPSVPIGAVKQDGVFKFQAISSD